MKTYSPFDPICFQCKKKSLYDSKSDSNYCASCNIWLEKICATPCTYCEKRRKKPISKFKMLFKWVFFYVAKFKRK